MRRFWLIVLLAMVGTIPTSGDVVPGGLDQSIVHWSFSDYNTMITSSGYTYQDIGKIAIENDNRSYWLLDSVYGPTSVGGWFPLIQFNAGSQSQIGWTDNNASNFLGLALTNNASNQGAYLQLVSDSGYFQVKQNGSTYAGGVGADVASAVNLRSSVGDMVFSIHSAKNVIIQDGTTGTEHGHIGDTGSDFRGTTTNDNATAGFIGEWVESWVSNGSAVPLSNGVSANITSISLTAGDWDVEGSATFKWAAATISNNSVVALSTTSATIGSINASSGLRQTTTTSNDSVTPPRLRVSVAATTTVYLVGQANFSAGTCGGYGGLNARRAR